MFNVLDVWRSLRLRHGNSKSLICNTKNLSCYFNSKYPPLVTACCIGGFSPPIAKADVLVSWNFKHIANLDRIRGCNGINYQTGYKMIEIRTLKEITKYGNED